MNREEILKQWPNHFNPDKGYVGILTTGPCNAVLFPNRSIKVYLKDAEDHGAKIMENTKVVKWKETKDKVTIHLKNNQTIEAK